MSVADGQLGNAATFNGAFVSKSINSTTIGQVSLANASPSSGDSVSNIQREFNAFSSYTGKTLNVAYDTLPSWSSNDIGASSDSLFDRIEAIQTQFPIDMDSNVQGVLPIANGGTNKSAFNAGQVHFGDFSQSSAFFYNSSAGYLGLGTSAPSGNLDIDGSFCLRSEDAVLNASGAFDSASQNSFIRITSAAGTELYTIAAPSGNGDQVKILANVAGVDIDVTSAGNIETDGQTITFAEQTLILLVWDKEDSIWRILAGGGGSSAVLTNFDETDTTITCVGAQEQIWRYTEASSGSITLAAIDFSLVPQGGRVTFTSQSDNAYTLTIPTSLSNVIMNGEFVGAQYCMIVFQRIGPRIIEVSRNGI